MLAGNLIIVVGPGPYGVKAASTSMSSSMASCGREIDIPQPMSSAALLAVGSKILGCERISLAWSSIPIVFFGCTF